MPSAFPHSEAVPSEEALLSWCLPIPTRAYDCSSSSGSWLKEELSGPSTSCSSNVCAKRGRPNAARRAKLAVSPLELLELHRVSFGPHLEFLKRAEEILDALVEFHRQILMHVPSDLTLSFCSALLLSSVLQLFLRLTRTSNSANGFLQVI